MSYPRTSPSGSDREKKLSDEACGRLMEIYVQEAEQYDKGLVQSWKDDMDVTLVFSGLYSAVLTAFVIESYQKLEEDPADASVALLHRISDQLVSFSNGSTVIAEAPDDVFAPTSAALACNILWFLSLILALSCAFLATFVQQWSRQFIHKTGQLRSSTAHARLFSFLYFGLKDFHMHTVVNIIPSLLHLSLFSFLGGLIAFLRDVNPVLTYIVSFALTIVTAVYTGFTILPLIAANSPYQTPLSPIAWRIWHALRRHIVPLVKYATEKQKWIGPRAIIQASHLAILPILPTVRFPKNPPSIWQRFRFRVKSRLASLQSFSARARTTVSIVYTFLRTLPTLPVVYEPTLPPEAPETSSQPEMLLDLPDEVLAASQKPDLQRDMRCTSWTLSSLTNDQELLPFIEALPDAIYGPEGLHDNNLHLIRSLVETTDPQADIILRITSILLNASNSWFDDKHRARCHVACPKAIWALAYMFMERPGQFDLALASRNTWFPKQLLRILLTRCQPELRSTLDRKYTVSASLLCGIVSPHGRRYLAYVIPYYLHALGEMEPFELKRTSLALSRHLSNARNQKSLSDARTFLDYLPQPFISGKSALRPENSIVPEIFKENPLPRGHITRLDIFAGHCLQLPRVSQQSVHSVMEFVSKRADLDGWGCTQMVWGTPDTPDSLYRGFGNTRRSQNALRELIYVKLVMHPSRLSYRKWDTDTVWSICANKLSKSRDHISQRDARNDTAEIALQTMVAMRVVLVDAPNAAAAAFSHFKDVRQYIEEFVLCPEHESCALDDSLYDEDVKASRVVTITNRLLRRFLLTPDDLVATNDILDSLEFILFVSRINNLFEEQFRHIALNLRAVGEDLLVSLSKLTLAICKHWTERPQNSLNSSVLDIIAWTWQLWLCLAVPQSEAAIQNVFKALELMTCPGSAGKVNRYNCAKPKRVPAPLEYLVRVLKSYTHHPYDFSQVLAELNSRYRQSGRSLIHSQGLNNSSDVSTTVGGAVTARAEEDPGVAGSGSDHGSPSSQLQPRAPVSLALSNDRWVI